MAVWHPLSSLVIINPSSDQRERRPVESRSLSPSSGVLAGTAASGPRELRTEQQQQLTERERERERERDHIIITHIVRSDESVSEQ